MGNCLNEEKHAELSEQELEKLLANTSLDRATILEWHKNFVVNRKSLIFPYFFIYRN